MSAGQFIQGVLRGAYRIYNVHDFGEVGDGVHDDTAAFQACITAAAGKGPAIVPKPLVRYLVSSQAPMAYGSWNYCIAVPSHTQIIGLDRPEIQLNAADTDVCRTIFTNSDWVNGNTDIEIVGLSIDGNYRNRQAGTANNLVLIHMGVSDAGATVGCTDIRIESNKLYDGILGIGLYNYIKGAAKNSNCKVNSNVIDSMQNFCIEFDSTDNSEMSGNQSSNSLNYDVGGAYNLIFWSNNNTVDANQFKSSNINNTGIWIKHGSSGNIITNNNIIAPMGCIFFETEPVETASITENNTVSENYFEETGASSKFLIYNAAGSTFRNNTIRDNKFVGWPLWIRATQTAARDCTIDGLYIRNNEFIVPDNVKNMCIGSAATEGGAGTSWDNIFVEGNTFRRGYIALVGKVNRLFIRRNKFIAVAGTQINIDTTTSITEAYIDDNTAIGGNNFVYTDGTLLGLKTLRRNTIIASGGTAITVGSANAIDISDNDIDVPTTGYAFNILAGSHTFKRNKIHDGQYGITAPVGTVQTIKDCEFSGLTGATPRLKGAATYITDVSTEHFQGVLAASATAIRSNEDLSAATPLTFTLDAQPDVPRRLVWAFDAHAQITAFSITFTGVNAKDVAVTQTITEASGWSGVTNEAFATITSIIMTARTGTGAGDTIDIGVNDVIGLATSLDVAADVFKVKKNSANYPAASYTVEDVYDTIDLSTGGAITGGDDFTIWYKAL